MSTNVNPIPLRPVVGIVLAIDLVQLEMEQLMSWLQSGHHVANFFHLIGVSVSTRQLRGNGSEYYLSPLTIPND